MLDGDRLLGSIGPMSLQSMVRWLLPREDHFYDFLERQAEAAHRGARALAALSEGRSTDDVSTSVQDIEHEGDELVREMEEALARTFVTPLDREDLHKLSAELDDILDLLHCVARMFLLIEGSEPTPAMRRLMELLVQVTGVLSDAMQKLRKHDYDEIIVLCRTVRDLEKQGDVQFRTALSDLFNDPAIETRVLLREKEMLEDLEDAMDRCEHVANTLTNLSVKHG